LPRMVKFRLPRARPARDESPHLTVAVTISRRPNAQVTAAAKRSLKF
jgi:hypothetical protein